MDVGFTYNLKKDHSSGDLYAEWDDKETIEAVINALSDRHHVIPMEADLDVFEKLRKTKPEIVFNMAEGLAGPNRESQIPAILEMLQIPYTGSDPLTLGLCLDKARAKEILSYYEMPTPKFSVVSPTLAANDISSQIKKIVSALEFPVIIKPAFEGSSKGIYNDSLISSPGPLEIKIKEILDHYKQPVLIEEFLQGREFTVAVWGNEEDCQVLPIIELKFDTLPSGANAIYSYEAKWVWDTVENPLAIFQCPAQLDEVLEKKIRFSCLEAFKLLQCRDWCRIDLRLDAKEEPHILELNPLPGILPNPDNNSCFPKAARAAGFDYKEMINRVLDMACKRWGIST